MKKKYFLAMALAAFITAAHADNGPTPTRWYKFDNLTDGVVTDEAAPAENGRAVGNPALAEGIDGQALSLTGAAETYIDLDEVALLKGENFTIEAWINPTVDKKGTILAQTMPNGGNWQLYYEGSQIKFHFNRGSGGFNLSTRTYVPLNTWTHVALSREDGLYRLYVNGIVMHGRKDERHNPDATNTTIGAVLKGGTAAEPFHGAIDELRIYDRALTDRETGIMASRISPYHIDLEAENGKMHVAFAQKPAKEPILADFDGFIKVNDDIKVALKFTGITYNAADSTAELAFTPLTPAAVEQRAAIEVLYHKFPAYTELTVAQGSVSAPSISNLTIQAKALKTREILSAHYTYTDPAGVEEYESRYEWYVGDTQNGPFTLVKGVNTQTMMLLKAHNGKYVKVKVTPRNHLYAEGQAVESPVVGPIAEEKNNPRTDWMEGVYGISCHFLPNYLNLSPTIPENEKWKEGESWDDFLATFDVKAFAEEVNEVGAKFLILTINQHGGHNLCPNAAYDSICGAEPGEKSAKRDLPMEIADALEPYGIKLVLYYMGILPAKASMDYYDGLNDHSPDRWGDYLLTYTMDVYPFTDIMTDDNPRKFEKIIGEWGRRYGDKVAGFWFDGLYYSSYYTNMDNFYNENTLVHAARAGNPDRIVTGAGLGHREVMDYPHGEAEDIVSVPTSRWVSGNTYQQWFRWNPLGNHNINAGWGVPVDPDGRIFDTNDLAQWTRRTTNNGGCAAFDIRVNRYGKLDAYGKQQLLAVKEAVETNAIKPDACGAVRLLPIDAKVQGGPVPSPTKAPDHVGNWWNDGGSAEWRFLLAEGNTYNLSMETASVGTPMTATLEITGPDNQVILSKDITFPKGTQRVETAFGEVECANAGVYTLKLTKKSGDATDLYLAKLLPTTLDPVPNELVIDDFEDGLKTWSNIGDATFEIVDNPTGTSDCMNKSDKVLKYEYSGLDNIDYAGIILNGLEMPVGTSPDCSYRYLHMMIKKSSAYKVGVKVEGNGNFEKSVNFEASDHWVDVVIDMGQAGNKTFPTLFIQPDKNASGTEQPVYIDNIRFSNDPEPLFCENLTVVQPDENGVLTFVAADARLEGQLSIGSSDGALAGWASAGIGPVDGKAIWLFNAPHDDIYEVTGELHATADAGLDFAIDDADIVTFPCAKSGTYTTHNLGELNLLQGEHRLELTRTSITETWHYINILNLKLTPRNAPSTLEGKIPGEALQVYVRDGVLCVLDVEAGSRVSVYDALGNCLLTQIADGSEMHLNLSYRGMAIVQVNSTITKKIIL